VRAKTIYSRIYHLALYCDIRLRMAKCKFVLFWSWRQMSDDGDAHGAGFNLARPVNGISRLFGVIASLIPIKLRLATAGAPRRVWRLPFSFLHIIFSPPLSPSYTTSARSRIRNQANWSIGFAREINNFAFCVYGVMQRRTVFFLCVGTFFYLFLFLHVVHHARDLFFFLPL